MLYLATFLSLLVSLLLVLMDPVPQRQSLDTREGEAYVVGFLNQHQAAKDYLYYWLGTVSPGESVSETGLITTIMETYLNGSRTGGYNSQAQAIALPGGQLEEFLPKGLVSELHYQGTGGNISYLNFPVAASLTGSYHSALICLDNSNNLVSCYRYLCAAGCPLVDGVRQVVDTDFCATCRNLADTRQISFRTGVRPHVITYSDAPYSDAGYPAWWTAKGEPKAIRKELWRRAMTRRSHASHNCGVLFRAPLDASNIPTYRWRNENVGMINKIQPTTSSGAVYCIDNGNRCMKLLLPSIQGFLEKMVTDTDIRVDGQNDLQDVFFCISEVKNNPYESIAPATYHFDGINSAALGAPTVLSSDEWPSLTNRVLSASEDFYLPPFATDEDDNTIAEVDGQPTLTGQTITMPFQQNPSNDDDFTLIFVTEGPLNGNILNDPSAPYALYANGETLTFSYLDNANILHSETLTGVASIKKCIWQLVKEGTTLTLYWNGEHIQTVSPLPEGTNKVTFGPSNDIRNNMKLLNVRYYDVPLSDTQLKRMRDIDTKRFGMDKLPEIVRE